MTTEGHCERRELAGNEIDAIAGGGYIPQRTGFGVRTDTMIAVQAANEHLKGSLIQIYFG